MTDVQIYTRRWCGWCSRAKSVLERHGVAYEELDVGSDPGLERQMIQRSNGRLTVPQIFVRGRHVGGTEELVAFARRGGLEPAAAPPSDPEPAATRREE